MCGGICAMGYVCDGVCVRWGMCAMGYVCDGVMNMCAHVYVRVFV